MKFDEITVFHDYNKISKRQEPLFIDELALPFEFELEALPIKQKFLRGGFNYNISSAGILIRLRRNSLGQLLSGYYYPTTSFALLSMISFLINPDVVNHLSKFIFLLKYLNVLMINSFFHQSLTDHAQDTCLLKDTYIRLLN